MLEFKLYEGLGSFYGDPKDKNLHPNGRMGARLEVYNDGKLIFESENCSTLPDSLTDEYSEKYNNGMDIPVACEGTHDLYVKYHNDKKAFEVGKELPVMRKNVLSTSTGINFHQRESHDPVAWASSTGCLTILFSDLERLLDLLDINASEFNKNACIGILSIDRRYIDKDTYWYLAQHCNIGVENICSNMYYKTVIMGHCGLEDWQSIWDMTDWYEYSTEFYRKWAYSYIK